MIYARSTCPAQLSAACGKHLTQQGHRIDADRQRNHDIFIHPELALAGLVARHIGLLPSELLRQVDLAKPSITVAFLIIF